MTATVCKFGGSSVSDAGMFVRVNRILQSDPSRRYVVLSAPGKRGSGDEKITDLLYRAHEACHFGDTSILSGIFRRYTSIRDALAPDFDLETEFAHIQALLPSSADYAASRGEYLCAKLFAAYAKLPFVDATELFFFDAQGKIDLEATYSAVRSRLLPMERAVVPGFYGVRPDGSIRTFSRGGSDVSGALIAAALRASLYENWTDVDGLYTADPSIVPDARRNRRISLVQMERIAAAGAKLLHPEALIPLRGTGVDTLLKSTFSPDEAGTRISESCSESARCVTGRRKMYMLGDAADDGRDALLHALPMAGAICVSAVNVFGLTEGMLPLLQKKLKPIHIIHMQDHIQIIVPEKEYESSVRIAHELLLQS